MWDCSGAYFVDLRDQYGDYYAKENQSDNRYVRNYTSGEDIRLSIAAAGGINYLEVWEGSTFMGKTELSDW